MRRRPAASSRRRSAPRRPSRPGRNPRGSTVRASSAASSTEWTGDRRTPTCSRPPASRSDASTSRQIRAAGRCPGGTTASTRSSWSVESTIRVTAAAADSSTPAAAAPRGPPRDAGEDVPAHRVGAAAEPQRFREVGEHPGEARPGEHRRRTSRLRTDLLATRTGRPPARRTSPSALASRASRSTTANGGSRSAVARSSSTWGRLGGAGASGPQRAGPAGTGQPHGPLTCTRPESAGVTEDPELPGSRPVAQLGRQPRPWPRRSDRDRPTRSRPCSSGGGVQSSRPADRQRPLLHRHRRPRGCQLVCDGLADVGRCRGRRPRHRGRGRAAPAQRGTRAGGLGQPGRDIDRQTSPGAGDGTHGTGARFGGPGHPGAAWSWSPRTAIACDATTPARRPEVFSARIALGALGVVTAVTLQAVPAFALRPSRAGDAHGGAGGLRADDLDRSRRVLLVPAHRRDAAEVQHQVPLEEGSPAAAGGLAGTTRSSPTPRSPASSRPDGGARPGPAAGPHVGQGAARPRTWTDHAPASS